MTPREVRRISIGPAADDVSLAALDQTIVAPALPTIARDLHSFDSVSWVVTAYLLSATATTPILGKLSDLYGRRSVMMGSVTVFLVGSIACALAPSMFLLICARALQGAGGGALLALANTIIADVVSRRASAGGIRGYFASVFAIAGIMGPVLGGFLAEYISWTMIFWINLPIGLLAMMIARRALALLPVKGLVHHIDYLGSALMATATVSLLLALTLGRASLRLAFHAAASASSCFPAVLYALFLRQQSVAPGTDSPAQPVRQSRDPHHLGARLHHHGHLYRRHGLRAALSRVRARHERPRISGLVLIGLMVGVVGGALVTGQYMRFLGRYKAPPVIGVTAAAIGFFYLAYGAAGRTNLGDRRRAHRGRHRSRHRLPGDDGLDPERGARQTTSASPTANHMFFRSLGGAAGVAFPRRHHLRRARLPYRRRTAART